LDDNSSNHLLLIRQINEKLLTLTGLESMTSKATALIQEAFGCEYAALLINDLNGNLGFSAASSRNKPQLTSSEYSRISEVLPPGIILPLNIAEQQIGSLVIRENEGQQPDVLLLQVLADAIAIAVQRIALYGRVARRSEYLAAIAEVSRATTSILDLDLLLKRIAELIHDHFKIPYVHIYLVQPDKNEIFFMAGAGERAAYYKETNISFKIDSEEGVIAWVAREKQAKWINDVSQVNNYIPSPLAKETQGSELALPLLFGDNILGILDLQSPVLNAFEPTDIEILETLAKNIAVSVRNAKLYNAETWRRRVAESVKDVAIQLAQANEIEQILSVILKEIAEILPTDGSAIWLTETNETQSPDSPEKAVLAACMCHGEVMIHQNSRIYSEKPTWFWDEGLLSEPVIRKPGSIQDNFERSLDLPVGHSAIAASITAGEQLLGFLVLYHKHEGKFGNESINVTTSFSGFAAIAIDNFRLFQNSQKQAWISTVLLQVANATQSLTSISELADTVVRLTPLLAGIEGCGLFLREDHSDLFLLHAIYGSSFNDCHANLPMAIEHAPAFDRMIHQTEALLITDPLGELMLEEEICAGLTNKTVVLLPLITHGELLGAFLVVKDHPFTANNSEIMSDETMMIIQGISQLSATAAENIRLSEARQEEAYASTILLQVAQEIVSNNQLEDILESIVNLLPLIVGIDSCVIYQVDQLANTIRPQYFHTNKPVALLNEALDETTYEIGDFPLIDEIMINNQAIIQPITTPLSLEDWDLIIPDGEGKEKDDLLNTKSGIIIGIPFMVNNELVGALVTQEESFRPNRKRRFELINGIAQQAILAIQNDLFTKAQLANERLNREFQLAREIQKTFLPEVLPPVKGYEIDVLWKTARQVGGDFYDIFQVAPEQYALLIADVSDKGLAASLYMAVARTMLRGVADVKLTTSRTLEKLNELLLGNSQKGLFVTIFYGILDSKSGNLRYTNAGHNPPYIMRQGTNQLIALAQRQIAIGAMPDIKLAEKEVTLLPGDYLVMHTDGVTETFSQDGQLFGEVRYQEALAKCIGLEPRQLLVRIDVELTRFSETDTLSDDTTMMAIRRIA